jgi:hypothetical protein
MGMAIEVDFKRWGGVAVGATAASGGGGVCPPTYKGGMCEGGII